MAEEKSKKEKDAKNAKDGEGEAAPAPAKKSKKALFIGVGAGVGLLLLIGIPLIIMLMRSKPQIDPHALPADAAKLQEPQHQPEGAAGEEEIEEGEEPLGAILPLETFILNLSGGKYIRMQIQFEFDGRDIPKRLYPRMVPLRDAIITLVTRKAADDLASEKGKEILRKELRDTVNEMLRKEEVKRVYFTQFVIQ